MIRFDCDYLEGAHPAVLQRLLETNMDQTPGYGEDPYCRRAAEKIRMACGVPDAAVHFTVGGTQTNTAVISAVLRPWEGVFSADSGHINRHEGNGVEGSGHKVLALPGQNGKLTAESVEAAFCSWQSDPAREHIVQPGMVYISHPTETGTLYTKAELTALHEVCRKYHLPLFLDGARLIYALAARDTDLTLRDIARLCDVFYIGGTKAGTLFGEAVVIPDAGLVRGFRPILKQRGALLAKGRLLGVQFDALFTDELYRTIGEHAILLAEKLRRGFADKGYPFMYESPTNQQFPILTDAQAAALAGRFAFEDFGPAGEGRHICRFCTSWATKPEDVDALLQAI